MSREENFNKIYEAVSGTELQNSFPGKTAWGHEASVAGIRWGSLPLPRSMHFQVALETMITVCDLALKHRILLKDRHDKNVMLSPVGAVDGGESF